MTTKEEVVKQIKEWIKHDDLIKKNQREIKDSKEQKKFLTLNLIDVMKTNEIDCFDINNGKILYCKNKTKVPLSKKLLLESLNKYFENIPNIDSSQVGEFILESRETIIKENIRRK